MSNRCWGVVLLGALLALAGGLSARSDADLPSTSGSQPAPAACPGWYPPAPTPATRAAGSATILTTTISIPTYPYARCLQLQTGGPPPSNYPYHKLDWACYGNPRPAPQDYRLLVLENDTLRVTLLPELGGRVYQMIFKPSGHNELYQNPVIKPTHWGPTEMGWWLAAGGIEWCLPVDEHGYAWGEPWTYAITTSDAGITVTLRDTSATNRLRTAVAVHLPASASYIAITHRLENPTASSLSGKYWSNAMLAPGPANTVSADTRFVFASSLASVHSTGDCRLPGCWPTQPSGPSYTFTWPVYNGVDYSRLGNWHEWLGFFAYPQATGGFTGIYDTGADEGVVRIFPPETAHGAKGFGMGWASPIHPSNWTDDGSTYVELHGGLAATFWDWASLSAGEKVEWTEVWYPVRGIRRLDTATAEAALGASVNAGVLTAGVHATRAYAPGETTLTVWRRDTCAEVAHWALPAIDPATPFVVSAPVGGQELSNLAIVYTDRTERLLAALHFRDCLPPEAWVEALPLSVDTGTFTVTWAGRDAWSPVTAYDVQVRDGVEGAWSTWQSGTAAQSALFSGTHGHTYFFRARARDGADNWGDFGAEEWGQAFTTVLTEPAPVLVTSRKRATTFIFPAGRPVSYTMILSNTGTATASVNLRDTFPISMALVSGTLATSSGPLPVASAGALEWNAPLGPQQEVRLTYALTPTAVIPSGLPLTNSVIITGSVLGPIRREVAVMRGAVLWLPVALCHPP